MKLKDHLLQYSHFRSKSIKANCTLVKCLELKPQSEANVLATAARGLSSILTG